MNDKLAFLISKSEWVEVIAINKNSPYESKAIVRMPDGKVINVKRKEIQFAEDKRELIKLQQSLRREKIGENPEYFSSLKYLLKNGSPIILN